MFGKQFGGKITKDLLAQYEQSENWKNGMFQNLEETSLSFSPFQIPRMLYKQFANAAGRTPSKPLAVHPFPGNEFLSDGPKARFIWYGHSVLLMRLNGKTILIDPMLGPDASPIAPISTKRFSENTLDLINDFPEIDLMLMTHDHYDHLDLASISKLKSKTKKFFVALGVKRHLVKWGVDPELITEFDWWDNQSFENIEIHFTPTRHFSGRGISDRTKSLWGGWVFRTEKENIWFSGDGGYGKHFKEIGERLGPFDIGFMECGQYNDDWHPIHLFPEESVQAAIDAKAQRIMPVHWAGFSLSYQHKWHEPAAEFVQFSKKLGLPALTPEIGELFSIENTATSNWWEAYL